MANLTTKQTIKVKVNQLDGSLVPQSKQPVVLKNTIQDTPSLGSIGNVNESAVVQGGTLVYNSTTQLYDVRKLELADLGGITNSPANNDILFYNSVTDSFYYGSVVTSLAELSDVDTTGRANGMVLVYNSGTNTYTHATPLASGSAANVSSLTVNGGAISITSISNFANTTQLGSNASGSATELVTAKAVKDYIDTVVAVSGGGGGGASNLNGLLDVYIDGGGLINRQVLMFNGATNQWMNRDIHGTANNIWMTTNANNDIVVALANDVVIANTLTSPSANITTLTANTIATTNVATFGNNVTITGTLGVGQTLSVARVATFSNNVVIAGGITTANASVFNSSVTVNSISTFTNTVTIQANAVVGQQLSVNGTLSTSGPVVFGNTSATVTFDARVASDIIPANDSTVSLGSPTKRFKDLYLSGNTLYVGAVQLSGAAGDFTVNSAMTVVGNTVFNSNVIISDRLSVDGAAILNGNVTLGTDDTNTINVKGSITGNVIPSSNDVYTLGNTSTRFSSVYAHNIIAVAGQYSGDVTISGNLVVQGNKTEISVESVQIEDPLLKLSANNVADTVDIGFYGVYNDGSTERYTGLARDATDGNYFLFANLVAQPNTTVLVTSPSFQLATLNSYINGGGLTTTPTSISVTANSTTSVTIAANTLSLTTGLGALYGGTGRQSLTNNAVVVGNGSSSVKQISGTNSQLLCVVGGVPTFVSSIDAGEY